MQLLGPLPRLMREEGSVMSMVPFESGKKWPSEDPGTISQREAEWMSLTIILAVTVGIIAVCIYMV